MEDNRIPEVQTTQKVSGSERRIFTFKATQFIWLVFGILEGMVALRVLLKLIGANPDSPLSDFVYGFTDLFLLPFRGLVGTPTAGNMVLEISSLIAMAVYAMLAWGIERLIWVIFFRPRD